MNSKRGKRFGMVRRLPSGRYQASYYHDGRRHNGPRTYPSKADANAWLAVQQAAIVTGDWAPPRSPVTVAELGERWLGSQVLKQASSAARDLSILRTHVLPVIGREPIHKVTKADLQELVDSWSVKGLAPHTVCRQASCLTALFNYAVDAELLHHSPASKLRVPDTDETERPELAPADYERLAQELGRYGMMLWVEACTGLNWAECAALTVDDLDVEHRTIKVERQLNRSGNFGPLKTKARRRTIEVPEWLVDDLVGYMARTGLREGLLFTTPSGRPLRYTNWRPNVWVPACEKAGLPGLDFHALRSNHATALVDEGVNVKVAQERLGHAQIATTLGVYARATREGRRAAAEAIGQRLRPVPSEG